MTSSDIMEFMALLESAFSPLQKQETLIYHLNAFFGFFSHSGCDFENTLVLVITSGHAAPPKVEPGEGVSEQSRARGRSRA